MLYASRGTTPGAPAPALTITSPTGGGTYTTSAATVTLAGTAQHQDGIAQVFWANSARWDRGGVGDADLDGWAGGIAVWENQITVMARADQREHGGEVADSDLLVPYRHGASETDHSLALEPQRHHDGQLGLSDGHGERQRGVTQVTWLRSISAAGSDGNAGVALGTSVWRTGR